MNAHSWTGKNVFGDLLTHLRRRLMAEPEFREEAVIVREARASRKRVLEEETNSNSVQKLSKS